MKKIIFIIILSFLFQTKALAYELNTWDNLKIYFYSPKMLFNEAIDLYKTQEYEKADLYLDFIKCDSGNQMCSKKYYNKGNINYKLGEQRASDAEKIYFWQKAIENYNKSLTYFFDSEASDNIDFIKSKISELQNKIKQEKKQEEKKENEKKDTDKNQKKEEQKTDNKTSSKSDSEQEQQVIKNSSIGLGGDKNDTDKLSESDKHELEEYYKSLQDEEKQNQQYFNKKNTKNQTENPFDSMLSPFRLFGVDPFFDENIDGGNSDNKKDW